MMDCTHHEAIETRLDTFERDRTELWNAVTEIRKDLKGISWRVGLIVGGIATISSVANIVLK